MSGWIGQRQQPSPCLSEGTSAFQIISRALFQSIHLLHMANINLYRHKFVFASVPLKPPLSLWCLRGRHPQPARWVSYSRRRRLCLLKWPQAGSDNCVMGIVPSQSTAQWHTGGPQDVCVRLGLHLQCECDGHMCLRLGKGSARMFVQCFWGQNVG